MIVLNKLLSPTESETRLRIKTEHSSPNITESNLEIKREPLSPKRTQAKPFRKNSRSPQRKANKSLNDQESSSAKNRKERSGAISVSRSSERRSSRRRSSISRSSISRSSERRSSERRSSKRRSSVKVDDSSEEPRNHTGNSSARKRIHEPDCEDEKLPASDSRDRCVMLSVILSVDILI